MATFSRRKRATEVAEPLCRVPTVTESLSAALEEKENAAGTGRAAGGAQPHTDSRVAAEPFKKSTGKGLQAKVGFQQRCGPIAEPALANEQNRGRPVEAEAGDKGSAKLAERLALMLPKAAVYQREAGQLLCELPAHLASLDGNSGVLGRIGLAGEEALVDLDLMGVMYTGSLCELAGTAAVVHVKPGSDAEVIERLFPSVLQCTPHSNYMLESAELPREVETYDQGIQHDERAHDATSGKGAASRALRKGAGGGARRKGAARKRTAGAQLKKSAGFRKHKQGMA